MYRATVVVTIIGLCGCSSPEALPRLALLDTPLGASLDGLWKGHGGIAIWSRFRAVEFRYEGEGEGARVDFRRLLMPLDDTSRVWVEMGDPADSTRPLRWASVELGNSPLRSFDLESEFALRSMRHLFHLPFFLANPEWELRVRLEMDASSSSSVAEFEGSPLQKGLIGPFFFRADELRAILSRPDRRLERVFYLSRLDDTASGYREIRFAAFESVQGLVVATEREHIAHGLDRHLAPSHPFEPAQRQRSASVWKERLSSIRFLDDDGYVAALERGELPSAP